MYEPGLIKLDDRVSEVRENVAEDVARDARRYAPKDTGQMASTIRVVNSGKSSRVIVGTNHWYFVEYGTGAHPITAVRRKVLANKEKGEFYGKTVLHPGTPQQPFMRRAIYQRRALRRF